MNCQICGKSFIDETHSQNQKFCGIDCRRENQRIRFEKYRGKSLGLATGTVGAISELKVSADLMTRGFEVYRALSQSSSCDLFALKDGKSYDFEVRTGYFYFTGKIFYIKTHIKAKYIAVYIPKDNSIHYFPPIF